MHPSLFGVLGFFAMVVFYYILLAGVTRDLVHPIVFFWGKWYLLAPLFFGFGVQMFLFQKVRVVLHSLDLATAGASVGTSGVAMAACCAHHLAELLPVLGFLGFAAFVTAYQDWFLALGVSMNVLGALYMWMKLRGARRLVTGSSSPCCSYG